MFAKRLVGFCKVAALSLPLVVSVAACAGGQGEPKMAEVAPGAMPAGGEWTGVYYSQTYGMLHILAEGDSVNGAWRTTSGDAWGELYGKTDGDMLRYSWTEHKIGMIGEGAVRSGKGYFKYVLPDGNNPHEITGEWGLGEDEVGNPWSGIKQSNVEPDPDSVKPDEVEGRFHGGGWDDDVAPDEESGSPLPSDFSEEP